MVTSNTHRNKRIAKNTFFLYGRMIVVLFVSLYTTRVVLNVLGIEDYGIYNVVGGFVSMFAFLNTSMVNSIQRFYNYEIGKNNLEGVRSVYSTALLIQMILALITLVLLESFGVWYINNKMVVPPVRLSVTNYVFQFSVFSLLLGIMQIPYSSAIISHEKMDYYAIVSIVDVIVRLILVILLPHIPSDKLLIYSCFTLVVSILNFFLYFFYSKLKFEEIKVDKKFDGYLFKNMLSFSGWNVFESVAYTIQGQGLNVLINGFFGPAINAARGIAFNIQNALKGFSENISVAFRPQLVESYAKNDYRRTMNMMYTMSKACYIMLFLLATPVVLEISYILNLWLDGTVPDFTVKFTILCLINMVLGTLNMPISQTVQAVGRIRNYQVIRSCLVFCVLPISWIALKFGYDATSVFWATLFISIINQPMSMILLHKVFKYSYKDYMLNVIFPCLAFSTLSPIIPIVIHISLPESLLRLIFVCIGAIIGTFIVVYYIVLSKAERIMVLEFIKSKIYKQ